MNTIIIKNKYTYPILQKITSYYAAKNKTSLENVYILACQHLLEPNAKMFELLVDFGIPRNNIYLFGKIYSTSDEILKEMESDGFKVNQPLFDTKNSFDIEHKENCQKALNNFISSIIKPARIIIIDDGGELLKLVNERMDSLKGNLSVVGVEQTSSGFRKLENANLKFPIFNVARSSIKLVKESPLIAKLGCDRITDVIRNYLIPDPRILVVGLGPMGSNTLTILKKDGYSAFGYDTAHHEKTELVDLIKNNNINIVIGVTGSNILNENQIEYLKKNTEHKLYLISMSSADREFPTVYIRNNGIVPVEVHGDVLWNNIILINNGFPITFKGKRYESTPEEIEKTIALLYGSTLESLYLDKSAKNGFIDVPESVTNIIEKYE